MRAASGIAADGDTLWIGSTYNRFIIASDIANGKLKAKYSTPGAGQIYSVVGDAPGRRTSLQHAYPPPPPPPPVAGTPTTGGRQGAGRQDDTAQAGPVGTGAHCILVKGNLLYVAVPPARMIFVIDKNTWVVQNLIQTAGSRPHDMTWTNAAKTHFWASDFGPECLLPARCGHRPDDRAAATGVGFAGYSWCQAMERLHVQLR